MRNSPPPLGTGARDPHIWLSTPRISFVACHTPPAGQLRRQDRDMRTPPRRFRGAQPNGDKTACARSVDEPTLATSVRPLVPHLIGKLGRLARCRPLNRASAARHGVPTLRGSGEPAAAPPSVSGEYPAARISLCICAVRSGTPLDPHTTLPSSTLPIQRTLQEATGERQSAAPSQPYCMHDRI